MNFLCAHLTAILTVPVIIGITDANRCHFVVTNSSPVGEVPKAEGYKSVMLLVTSTVRAAIGHA